MLGNPRISKVVYVDPFSGGHHGDQLAFYLPIFERMGFAVDVHTPLSTWIRGVEQLDSVISSNHVSKVDLGLGLFVDVASYLRNFGQFGYDPDSVLFFFPMLDPFVAPIALERFKGRKWKLWTGVYFRDSFNYPGSEFRRPFTLVKSYIKFLLLAAVAGRKRVLLTYSPRWAAPIPSQMVWLPDALSILDCRIEMAMASMGEWPLPKSELRGRDENRTTFLIFGAIKPRKGILETLQALEMLRGSDLCRIKLNIFGKCDDESFGKEILESAKCLIARGLSFAFADAYFENDEVLSELIECDVVLLPYINHVGSSGVLGLAAKVGRRVICQDRYQIGAEVARYGLGVVVDPSDRIKFADAILSCLDSSSYPAPAVEAYKNSRSQMHSKLVVERTIEMIALS